MRGILLLALVGLAASGAQAQSRNPLNGSLQTQGGYPAVGDPRSGPSDRNASSGSSVECLVRKADGQRVCHTKQGWKKVARQLAQAEPRGR